MRLNVLRAPTLVLALTAVVLACSEHPGSEIAPTGATAEAIGNATILAAGDIAGCQQNYQDEATATMLADMPGTILALGDVVYENGTRWQFRNCYGPSWGRLLGRTRPAPGNHEYRTDQAWAYYEYFGDRAGPAGRGYYTFTLGAWRLYSLNSERNIAEQATWLRKHLKQNPSKCVLAYWHKPLYTSGDVGATPEVRPLFLELWRARAEVVLNGHEHVYERFDPQDADSNRRAEGVRQFVVGTGGAPLRAFAAVARNSKVRYNAGLGVLEMTLRPESYKWRFVPVPGAAKADSGSANCV